VNKRGVVPPDDLAELVAALHPAQPLGVVGELADVVDVDVEPPIDERRQLGELLAVGAG
jgi:hypothetical protein